MWDSCLCPLKRQTKLVLILQYNPYCNQQRRCFCSLFSSGADSFDYTRYPCMDLVAHSLPKPSTTHAQYLRLNCSGVQILPSHMRAEAYHSYFTQVAKWSTRCQPVPSNSAHLRLYWIFYLQHCLSHILKHIINSLLNRCKLTRLLYRSKEQREHETPSELYLCNVQAAAPPLLTKLRGSRAQSVVSCS